MKIQSEGRRKRFSKLRIEKKNNTGGERKHHFEKFSIDGQVCEVCCGCSGISEGVILMQSFSEK